MAPSDFRLPGHPAFLKLSLRWLEVIARRLAAPCDETAHLLPEVQKAAASAKLVAPERLADAVSRYIDREAFAH